MLQKKLMPTVVDFVIIFYVDDLVHWFPGRYTYTPRGCPPTRLVIEFTGHDKDYPSNKGQIGGGSLQLLQIPASFSHFVLQFTHIFSLFLIFFF